jgi:hypothetical protein
VVPTVTPPAPTSLRVLFTILAVIVPLAIVAGMVFVGLQLTRP